MDKMDLGYIGVGVWEVEWRLKSKLELFVFY